MTIQESKIWKNSESNNQFFDNEAEIKNWLKEINVKVKDYTINKDLTVDVKSDVFISDKSINELPVKFREVSGYFYIGSNKLITLKGCPEKVGGDFNCSWNKLTSLEFAPKEIGGNFLCICNELTSLKFAPKEVNGSFECSNNKLTSLEFAPEKVKEIFACAKNLLTTLEHAPREVGEEFYCKKNPFDKEELNHMESDDLKVYVKAGMLAERLEKIIPYNEPRQLNNTLNDFRTIIDSKQIQDLHAQILERNKTVEIPDTYITETVKPKNEIKDSIIRMDPSQIHKVIEDAKNSVKEPELKSNVVSIAEVKNDKVGETQLANAPTRPIRKLKL